MKLKVEGVPDTKKESEKKEYSSYCCRVLPFARQGDNFSPAFSSRIPVFARPNVLTSVIHIAIAFLVRRTTFQILASTI
jgi:hypothetical protein